jgi:ABC-type amino acid transport system permease subunit
LQSASSREIIIAVLFVIGASGVAFFLQLIRLRQAWRQSALAMNIIKEHYIEAFNDTPRAAQMFHWRLRTLPKGEKYTSMSFVICMTVALLDSLGFAAAALLALLIWLTPQLGGGVTAGAVSWGIALLVLIVVLLAHLVYFSRTLSAKNEAKATAAAAAAAGLPPSVLK